MSEDNWKHRSKGMKCGTCMWWIQKAFSPYGRDEAGVGRCRKHAPTLQGWPVLFNNDWCGDHKLDENKVETGED